MKTSKALKIMKMLPKSKKGFMVSFEKAEGNILRSDHFPDKHAGEVLISTEKEAWSLAERFTKHTDENYVNIYVIDETFSPVKDYDSKMLKKI